jgi:hypothetical protein
LYLLSELQSFQLSGKTSGSDDDDDDDDWVAGEKVEDGDADDKVGVFDGCDWATALPDDDDCNKCTNCTYMVSPVRTYIKSIIKKKLTNNTYTALNFIALFSYLFYVIIKILLNYDHIVKPKKL